MIVGYNHNASYRGKTFHVQTEDSGPVRPQLVTLLYFGGTIIASKKTVYADIIKVDHLDKVVEELAKEQHKGMLRSLTRGEFDRRIEELGIDLGAPQAKEAAAELAKKKAEEDKEASAKHANQDEPQRQPVIVAEPTIDKFKKSKPAEPSLDELIYAYLTAGQGKS